MEWVPSTRSVSVIKLAGHTGKKFMMIQENEIRGGHKGEGGGTLRKPKFLDAGTIYKETIN